MDTWNILAGIASILSLIFHLSGKDAGVKGFTFPITMALVGFCIGRAGNDFSSATSQFFQDPYLMLILCILILLFALAMYLVESNKMEARMSYIYLVFLSTVIVPYMLHLYTEISPNISNQDYLVLAQTKENSGSTEDAIKYLRIYSKRSNNKEVQKQIDSKIEELKKQQFKQDFRAPAKTNSLR
jgi:cytochrome bd-type quinol oxidase subunit 2